ncbi:MAG: exo-alpha-sialidase [Ruminococcaceae bacterium]|nr:exo-alpha-sialidase [Oscillospiraceae bacterium]
MKGCTTWSYHPYKPLLWNTGDIYVCRLAPGADYIHLEWLAEPGTEYAIYYRKRDEGAFVLSGTVTGSGWDITGLEDVTDYELYVQTGEKKSRVRLARTGLVPGTVVNYLHPDDDVYSFSGRYLCSPSILRHPEGFLLASMDLFAGAHPQNLTLIFRSDDDGKTWHYVSELMPCFWGKLFLHKDELYMLSCSTEYGDLLIGKSTDGGKTFSAPVTLLRGANGKNGSVGVHKNPENFLIHNGRLYQSLEWGAWANKDYCHAAMVMSCAVDDDLLDPANWHFTEPVKFDESFDPRLAGLGTCVMMIEGTVVLAPDGRLLNIMRFGYPGHAIAFEINQDDPDAPLAFSHLIPFPANKSKFMIKQDPVTGQFFSVASYIENPEKPDRRLMTLMRSGDLMNWEKVCDLLDGRAYDPQDVGFQYVDFFFEGNDILYLCRTAMNKAHNYHDANYSTFHRIENFRSL